MRDMIGPLLEIFADIGLAGVADAKSPKWLQWGCAVLAIAILATIVVVMLLQR
ncbi:MAG: hypothetical protein K2Y20_04920 [Sphingomonas sp.]|nr:hypothetical protein [Sphingomonas sp.]